MTDQEEFGSTRPKKVDFKAVQNIFTKAISEGIKKMQFRTTEGLCLSLAPMTGANPGAIYVKDMMQDEANQYLGKIVDGVFKVSTRVAIRPEIYDSFNRLVENPVAEAQAYGRMSGKCAICGAELTDPKSIAISIGPICAARIGYVAEEVAAVEKPVVYTKTVTVTITTDEAMLIRRLLADEAATVESDFASAGIMDLFQRFR